MSTSLTSEEKIKIVQWILENFEVDQQRKHVKIPTDVEGEKVLIPLKTFLEALKDAVVQALRNNEDPWVYVANVQMTPPSTDGLTPCESCGGKIRTLTPEEHFNRHVKREAAEKLKIKFLDEALKWLK